MQTLPGTELSFDYDVDRAALDPSLRDCFLSSAPDAALRQFIELTTLQRAGSVRTFAFRSLQRVLSDYDAYGMLRMYRMHLLGSEQWRALLGRDAESGAQDALLDVGAGDGGVTHFARPLFQRICVTETAKALSRMLRKRKLQVFEHDLGLSPWPTHERFEVVSLLNVLDRTSYPRRMLEHAIQALRDEGTLLISVPLPLRPHVHVGSSTVDPEETLPSAPDGFELQASTLARELLLPAGLTVTRWTRLPYLSHGDACAAFYVLDAAVFACTTKR